MGFALSYLAMAALRGNLMVVIIGVIWVFVGRAIRGISHLREHPGDVRVLPMLALITIYISLPVKAWAFVTMNTQGWLTRQSNQIGGEGQTEASLNSQTTAFPQRELEMVEPLRERSVGMSEESMS